MFNYFGEVCGLKRLGTTAIGKITNTGDYNVKLFSLSQLSAEVQGRGKGGGEYSSESQTED